MRTLLTLTLTLTLLGAALPAQTIREDDTALHERCEATAPVMARLPRGTPVKLRLTVVAPSSACVAVTADLEGRKLQGYLDKDALDGLDRFDEERRKAAATEMRVGSRPGAAARPVGAKPWPAARPVFTPLATKIAPQAKPPAAAASPLQPAPDFSFGAVSRKSLLGKTYLLQFWAGWCKPCAAQTAELRRLYEGRQDREFEIVTVSLEGSSQEAPWPRAVAEGGFRNETVRRFGVERLPATLVIDREGRIVGRDLEGSELERVLIGR
jgi:thiol-disulfide isomerase/thioredoxin